MTIKLPPARTREKIESIRGHAVDVWTFGRGGRPDLPWLMADEKRFQWALDHLPWKNDNAIAELARHRFASDVNANTMVSRVRTLRRFLIQCADVIGLPHVREDDGAVRLLPLRAARSARDIYVRAQEEFHSRTSRTRAPLPALLGDPELFEAFYRRLGWMSLSDIHEDLVTYLGPRRGLHVNQLSRVWMFLDRHHLSPTDVRYRRGLPRPVYGIWRECKGRVIRHRRPSFGRIDIACSTAHIAEAALGPWDRWASSSRDCAALNHALDRHDAFSGASQ